MGFFKYFTPLGFEEKRTSYSEWFAYFCMFFAFLMIALVLVVGIIGENYNRRLIKEFVEHNKYVKIMDVYPQREEYQDGDGNITYSENFFFIVQGENEERMSIKKDLGPPYPLKGETWQVESSGSSLIFVSKAK